MATGLEELSEQLHEMGIEMYEDLAALSLDDIDCLCIDRSDELWVSRAAPTYTLTVHTS